MVNKIKKVIKRKVPSFKRPNYGAKGRSRVKDKWRRQRGNDNHMRVKKKNVGVMPMIGFKNSDDVRFLRQDGTMEFVIHNRAELEGMAGKEGITAKFAHGLSRRTRAVLQKAADEKKIRIANRLNTEAKSATASDKTENRTKKTEAKSAGISKKPEDGTKNNIKG